MTTVFKLPDLGENIESAQVVSIAVAVGDHVEAEQTLLEVETDKAVTDVPAPVAGRIAEIAVSVGDKLSVGDLIAKIEEGATEGQTPESPPAPRESSGVAPAAQEEPRPAPAATAPLDEQAQAAEAAGSPPPAESAEPAAAVAPGTTPEPPPADESAAVPAPSTDRSVPAAPSVRKFAREIGIDVTQVPGSGPAGRISIEDVKAYSRRTPSGAGRAPVRKALPDFARWGDIDRQPMSNVRKKTALQMESGWQAPHVTLHDKADVTTLERFRQQYKARVEQEGGKLTITAMLVRIVAAALRKFPEINCSIDMAQNEIIYKKYVNIGIAMDTPRGLVVPVILHADQKTVTQLSIELTETAERARAGKLSLEEMTGGTFTLTNLGGIGIGHFTPIINDPEVAILGVGRSTQEPGYIDGQLQPRLMMPLSLSFDHRIVDGAGGARFLRWIVEAMEQPLLLAMEG